MARIGAFYPSLMLLRSIRDGSLGFDFMTLRSRAAYAHPVQSKDLAILQNVLACTQADAVMRL